MYKFEHAMHAYLTSVQMMTPDELQLVGLTEANRETLLSQKYPMVQDYTLKAKPASFVFKESSDGIETCFKHSPDLENNDIITNIGIAAHEANHSLRMDLHTRDSKNFYKNAGFAVFAASTIYPMVSRAVDFDYINLTSCVVVGSVLGLSTFGGVYQSISHYDDKEAYRHSGAIEQMLDPSNKSLEKIQKQKQQTKSKTSGLASLADRLIMGYPSDQKGRLFMLEGQEMVAQKNASFNDQHVAEIMEQTHVNIKNRAFNIYTL